VLLAPAPYAASAAYYFPMATRLVGVEVYKGPASTRFGPHTVGGAINLVTRPVPTAPAGALDVAVGSNTTIKAHAWGGTGGPRAGFVAEGVHLSTEGFKDLDGGGPTGFDHQEAMLKGKVGTDPDAPVVHALELKAGYARERSNETYLGLSADDFAATPYRRYAASQNDLMVWQRTQAELSWRVEARDFDLRTVAYHHYLSRQWTRLNAFAGGPDLHDLLQSSGAGQAGVFAAILRGEEDSTSADQVLQVGTNDRRFHAIGVQSVGHWRFHNDRVASQLEFGVRVHTDLVRRVHTEDPFDMRSGVLVPTGGPTVTTLDATSDALAVAVHLHEDLSLGPVRILPGVRMEAIRTHRVDVGTDELAPQWRVIPLPGLAIFGSPTNWLDVFAGAHRGFSPVAPGEPEGTRPETSWSYELGGRVATGGTRADLVGFFNDYVNLTGQCTLSGGCNEDLIDRQFSGGKAFVWGMEAMVGQTVRLPKQLSLEGELTWTWTGSRFRTGVASEFPQFGDVQIGDSLPYVPEQQGSARIGLTHPRGSLSLGGHLRGPMRDVAGQGPIPVAERIPTSFLLDLAAHVQVTRTVEGYVTITNLANTVTMESLRPFGARPSMPIQAMFGVKVTPAKQATR
jgi:Fe(3+) dicitrate transport protein